MPEQSRDPAAGGSALKRLLPAAVLLAGFLAFFAFGGHRYVGFDTLEEHREGLLALVAAHRWAAPLAFIGLHAVIVAFSVPGALVMMGASGFLFCTPLGAACPVAGATPGDFAVVLTSPT